MISPSVLHSHEIVTEYTFNAETQTQYYTGIDIDKSITQEQLQLCQPMQMIFDENINILTKQINIKVLQLLKDFIVLKKTILQYVKCCEMWTMNYPLLIEHILKETQLYYQYLQDYENNQNYCVDDIELFWNRIMMEHALFIRRLLDPSENELIQTANQFVKEYQDLLDQICQDNHSMINQSKQLTQRFQTFKTNGTKGLLTCEI